MPKNIRLAVLGRKGGVGKTTASVALASVFAQQGSRVLVVDLDPQSNVAFALGVAPDAPGSVELLLGKRPEPIQAAERLFVLPGNVDLLGREVSSLHPDELSDVLRDAAFDVIVFDCPPGNEKLEAQAISASSEALVVVDAHPFALIGGDRVLQTLEANKSKGRRGPQRWAIVMSRMDARRSADRDLANEVRAQYPDLRCFEVRQDVHLSNATASGRPVMEACPDARGVQDMMAIAEWTRA
jgi:chromosome partitioning protein